MRVVRLPETGVAEAWRAAARDLASRGVPGEAVEWVRGDAAASLFGDGGAPMDGPARVLKVPRGFVDLAEKVTHHSDPQRFARLYDLLLRLQERPRLLEDVADSGVARIMAMRKSVRRDMHKMTAFVRFREVEANLEDGRRRFFAWFEPEHPITEITAPFFARRFGDMDWMIATPHLCARFEGGALVETPGCFYVGCGRLGWELDGPRRLARRSPGRPVRRRPWCRRPPRRPRQMWHQMLARR